MRTNENRHCLVVQDGSIYDRMSETTIEAPAMIINEETGTLHAYGNRGDVKSRYEAMIAKIRAAGLPTDGITYLELDCMRMTREEQCYVLIRCVEHTASGFQSALCRHMKSDDALEWLQHEIQSVPIDVN